MMESWPNHGPNLTRHLSLEYLPCILVHLYTCTLVLPRLPPSNARGRGKGEEGRGGLWFEWLRWQGTDISKVCMVNPQSV